MAENMVVPGWSSITAGQWREFWMQVDLKRINPKNFQKFIDNPNKYSDEISDFISLSQAKKILGYRKVVGVTSFNKVWKSRHDEVPILYSERDLFNAADRNEAKQDDWRLVYYGGQSIRQLNKIIGTDEKHQPCFEKQSWYFEKEENFWADKVPPAGYYLINFQGLFFELNYGQQELKMAFKFGKDFERTNPHIFSEAATTIFKLTGKRIIENWYHRSAVCAASGRYVYLGGFDAKGWFVSDFHGADDKGILLSVSQKQNVELIIKEKTGIQKFFFKKHQF